MGTVIKSGILFLFLSLSLISQAQAESGCFTRRILDAIKLNKQRAPLYANLTQNASRPLSAKLIRAERLTLIFAYFFDLRSRFYEQAGIPTLCGGFVSMSKTPSIQIGVLPSPPPLLQSFNFDASKFKAEIKRAYVAAGFAGVTQVTREELEDLADPHYNCMVRHTLDSILRFATLAPGLATQSLKQRLPTSADFSWQLIQAHFLALSQMKELDRLATPLQARGIAILCNDVPPLGLP